MTTASLTSPYSPEENAVLFFRQIKRELGIPDSRQIVSLVSRVLSHVLKGISPQQTIGLLGRLPSLFQMLVLKNWKRSAPAPVLFDHLDELVDRIYEEDQMMPKSQFASEIEVLNTVVIILRRLDGYTNIFSDKMLEGSWVDELRQIPMEDAA